MREFRSPNPLLDSRRPGNGATADLNPPGFVWHPIEGAVAYELKIGPGTNLESGEAKLYRTEGRTLWLSPEALSRGTYCWAWRALGCGQDEVWSDVFTFHITEETGELHVPPASVVVERVKHMRPRHLLPVTRLEAFRADCQGKLKDEWQGLKRCAEERLAENFLMTEPPFLPDRLKEQDVWGQIWRKAMTGSRQMGQDAQLFALVYLIEQEEQFGRAAVERLMEFSRWDPEGSTSTFHNNETHMSVMNLGTRAYDWVHDLMDESEREAVRQQFLGRGRMTMERFERQDYGIIGYDNHSGRLLGFQGELCLVLAGECPEIEPWLDYVMQTTAGMFPWWGGKEGGWAQGVSYSSTYCYLFYHFIYGLREAAGVDFYRKPFFRNHGDWRLMCVPPNAYLVPFGDGRTNGAGSALSSWGLQRHLGRVYGDGRLLAHAEQIQAVAKEPIVESKGLFSPLSFLTPDEGSVQAELPVSAARVFHDIGWMVFRANLQKPEEDIRFTMRSSQYGTVSHSHGDQNSFVIEAFGEPLAIPSGLYALYSSVHHHGWTRQTRAHNAVTFDGAGQIVRSPEAVGAITAFHTDERLTYTLGDASAAYGDRIKRCTREVFCLDRKFFVLVDRFEPTYESMWTWHLHAARPMVVDAQNRRALVQYEKACMDVVFCHSLELRFRAWDGFDLMPFGYDSSEDLPENIARYHLDVFSAMPLERDALVTVLSPRRVTDPAAQITPLLDGQGEGARIEDGGCVYRVVIGKDGAAIDVDGIRCDGNAAVLFETADGILERAAVVGGQMLVVNGKEVDPSLMIFLEN